MKQEFELKAALADGGVSLRRRMAAAGWRLVFEGDMCDRRYDTPDRSLEGRDEVLRVRRMTATGEHRAVLGWKGPASERLGYKVRAEAETPIGDAETTVRILERLGFTEITLAIDRRVELYEKGGVRVRIEAYPRMDTLVEIEGDPHAVDERLPELGLPREAWKPWGLPEFVRRYEERTGLAARLATAADDNGPATAADAPDAADDG
jgi:predicted adenylyl cyclase CyaB